MSTVRWPDTEPPLYEAQVGYGQQGLPLVAPHLFGDSEVHFASGNNSLPLSTIGQSLTLFDSGTRIFSGMVEGDVLTVRMPSKQQLERSKTPVNEVQQEAALRREAGFRTSTRLFPCDVGARMSIAKVGEDTVMAYPHGSVLRLDRVAPKDPQFDPTYATTRAEFNKALPSLHHMEEYDCAREINQVLFDQPAGSGRPASRVLVRTPAATHILDLGDNDDDPDTCIASVTATPYFDLRDDKYVDCDLLGDLYAGVTADGTWRVHSLGTESKRPPIVAQGFDPLFEELSDWKAVMLFNEGTQMALASRRGLRLFTLDLEDIGAEPSFVSIFVEQNAGERIMDMKRDLRYPNVFVVLTSGRLMIYDVDREDPLQLVRTLQFDPRDVSLKLSMSLVDSKSIAIVHSQLSNQKIFFTYAYQNPDEPLLIEFVCDPYPVLLLTQTPINSTFLVEFSDTIVMLFDFDIDGCVVRKLLTSEPSKFQDYRPEPVVQFPGQFPPGKPPGVVTRKLENYDAFIGFGKDDPEPISVSEIAEKVDGLIKTWHKDGCPGTKTTLAMLGADWIPSSVDEFAEMLRELEKHYNTSAVRVRPHIDPVQKYEQLVSVYVEPSNETSDEGNPVLRKYILERKIRIERECRRLAAFHAYASCSLQPSKDREAEKAMKGAPLHISKLLEEWVVGEPAVNFDHWVEFGVRGKKRKALTQHELLSEVAASRNAIPKLSLASQAPSQRASLAPSQRASLAPSQRASLAPSQRASLAPESSRRQSATPSASQSSQNRSRRRKTLGGFR
ncbi:hypothetical protein CJU89_2345 [Yarrowia sp. B02]|nr:hypothetical protein CJU89_2345 [Yarrowia sp. B02]